MRQPEASPAPPRADQPRGLRRWWLDLSLRGKGLIVIAIPLIVLMGITAANLLLQRHESTERTVSLRARDLAAAASLVLTDALNAETGLRGYAVTRQPTFLQPYRAAVSRLGAERTSLRAAAAIDGYGRQQRAADGTTGQVLSELAQLRSGISRGVPAGTLGPALSNEKATMDRLRAQTATLAGGWPPRSAPRAKLSTRCR